MLDHNWHDQLYKRLLTIAMVTKFHYCSCGSQLFIKRFSSDGFLLIQALVAVVAAFPWHPIIASPPANLYLIGIRLALLFGCITKSIYYTPQIISLLV